ncbi:MAG: type II toxin-antitoxin system VapC family toxin [Methanobacteriota archaeon]|nr:MAG: type II toxin-antitoxin system VapC family toxin [Euryarchaeota archaeon]
MGVMVDSTFVIDVLRSDPAALQKSRDLDARPDAKVLSTPVVYEITAGLLYTRSRSEATAFRALASRFVILPFDEPAAARAAEVRAELMRLGRAKSHVDVMIAGVASAGGHVLITRDSDFRDIANVVGLAVEAY